MVAASLFQWKMNKGFFYSLRNTVGGMEVLVIGMYAGMGRLSFV